MLVKDEADVILDTLAHLAWHVDAIYVADNGSTDGTREILEGADAFVAAELHVSDDPEVGYWQSRKTTALAMRALEDGHSWVVPCDADEVWFPQTEPGRAMRDYFDGLSPDVMIVRGLLFHHLPTALDQSEAQVPSALERIVWRKRQPAEARFGKVAARLRPDLVIAAGNHAAFTDGTALEVGGLEIRHFSFRSPEQYIRKIRNGIAAYEATDLPISTGQHWRSWADKSDEAIADHFRTWFWARHPGRDDSLEIAPAPVRR